MVKVIKVAADNPWVEVNDEELMVARGTDVRATAKDLKGVSKALKVVQDRKRLEGFGNAVMMIPADLYFQWAINKPGCWDGEEGEKTLALFWDTYEDMRCLKGGSNPWKRSKKRD